MTEFPKIKDYFLCTALLEKLSISNHMLPARTAGIIELTAVING